MDKKVINTQGGENDAYLRSAILAAGNSDKTLAKIPGSLHFIAGLMLTPALRPVHPFIPNERDSLATQRILSARSEARDLPQSSQVSSEPPVQGTVSFFN